MRNPAQNLDSIAATHLNLVAVRCPISRVVLIAADRGSTLGEASNPAGIRPGVMLVAGNRQAQAVVRVVAVGEDGQVHFTVLPGSVEKNRHLIGRALA